MHKIYTVLLSSLFVTALSAQAPSYVDFEWDVLRVGYVFNLADGDAQGGGAFGGELRYNATDRFSLGFSGDFALISNNVGPDTEVGVTGNSLIVGDYYLHNRSAQRPFVGLGLGLYSTSSFTLEDGGGIDEEIPGSTGAGLAPRVGYEFGHIRLQGQYNITLQEDQSDYFTLTVALTLWGGYRGGGRDY